MQTNLQTGFQAGFVTGTLIAWLEVIKILLQSEEKFKSKRAFAKKVGNVTLRTTPQFAISFGGVCAIEFAVNSKIKILYGNYAGLLASACSGSLFLTPAEHIMAVSSW